MQMALPQRALMNLIERNPKVAGAAIRFLCQRLRETDQKLEAIALHRIEVRLARLMLSAIKMGGGVPVSGRATLNLGLSQSEVGLLIGASRPKVNLALTALEDMGAITRSGSEYVCDVGVLASIVDMD
jgi:CRP-like cAMP-binding protein